MFERVEGFQDPTTEIRRQHGARTTDASPSPQDLFWARAQICPNNRIGAQRLNFSYYLRNFVRINNIYACAVRVNVPK